MTYFPTFIYELLVIALLWIFLIAVLVDRVIVHGEWIDKDEARKKIK